MLVQVQSTAFFFFKQSQIFFDYFSILKNMRKFYLTYPEFDTQCVANLSWTNIRTIIRIDDKKERDYYFKECAEQNWTSRQLERNIRSGYYHRLLSTQENSLNE